MAEPAGARWMFPRSHRAIALRPEVGGSELNSLRCADSSRPRWKRHGSYLNAIAWSAVQNGSLPSGATTYSTRLRTVHSTGSRASRHGCLMFQFQSSASWTRTKSGSNPITAWRWSRFLAGRVKNNFQIVSSLLSIQARAVPVELRAHFEESVHRIQAMGLLHEKFYRGLHVETRRSHRIPERACQCGDWRVRRPFFGSLQRSAAVVESGGTEFYWSRKRHSCNSAVRASVVGACELRHHSPDEMLAKSSRPVRPRSNAEITRSPGSSVLP